MPSPDECSCITELEQLDLSDQYAEDLACDFVDTFGGVCPVMMDYVVQQIIARLVHVSVMNHDRSIEHNERKTLDATASYLFRLSKTAPAALKIIMDNAAMKGEPANARH